MNTITCPNCNQAMHQRLTRDTRMGMRRVCPSCRSLVRIRGGLRIFAIVALPFVFIASSIALMSITPSPSWALLALAVNLVVYVSLISFALPRLARYSLVSDHPHCINCHYDLYNRESQTCPECGKQQHHNAVQNQ